ncbi:MAG: DUF1501 domain-containing protein [Planctomycetes bacterium]|nr:DUF1501 domain-containing protein [Planctomycetota bacterium]
MPNRREFLRIGLGGFGSLSLPQLLRLRAAAPVGERPERTALIVVWLQGGASHLETYDPKPAAPSDVRGPYNSIRTTVPGIHISELLPQHARLAQRFTLLRSMVHTGFCHQQGNQQMFTGHPIQELKQRPDHPDLMTITHYVRFNPRRSLPAYVGVNPIPYIGAAYLGQAHEPFVVTGDPNAPSFAVPNIGLRSAQEVDRLNTRFQLVRSLDQLRRQVDEMERRRGFDVFQTQALELLAGDRARQAFDINQEDPRIRDRYGRNNWGQRCLLARRLVEAGVDLVTTSLDGSLCGRVGNWDDHAVNHHIFDAMKSRCQYFDQAVSALIEDLHQRGLERRVMVVVTGEFGRTPVISYAADSGSGVRQPGRDHWPRATSLLFSGGGIPSGQVIGGTDRLGGDVIDRRVGVCDFLATLYRHLGIDADSRAVTDPLGRPVFLLPQPGQAIPELIARR